MRIKSFVRFLAICSVAAVTLPLARCGGGNTSPQGPEMGELERYMSEHPELMVETDDEIDQEDEFAGASDE